MKIRLVNGPLNGRRITDLGTVLIRMGIAGEWHLGRPVPGTRSGVAVYEPAPARKQAFWLGNEWDGIHLEQIDHALP